MTDEQLLLRYRKYKRKRLLIIFLLIFLIIFFSFSFYYIYIYLKEDKKNNLEKNVEVVDTIPPEIILNTSQTEIIQGEVIDYLSYVDDVIDNVDSNLLEKIQYTQINTNIIGEHIITYHVLDSSNNVSQKNLKVIVNSNENWITETTTTTTTRKAGDKKLSTTTSTTTQKITENNNSSSDKIVKYFMFKDGYTMMNVAEKCADELKKTNRKGMCSPLQDENGIYIGMKLETE